MGQSTAEGFNLSHPLIAELQHEAEVTRTVLERVPTDKFEFRPHEKSMTFGELASHIVDSYTWYDGTLNLEEIDFATAEYVPFQAETSEELLDAFDKNVVAAAELLAAASDEDLMVEWTMRAGDQVMFSMPRIQVIRSMLMNHMIHHRGQLSVYLRLNDIPVPQIYGPSADEGQPPE
ncbi:MAG: DinB family protein [Acidobacteriota bacterium]|nr:DinB family protein [Acidobacteriota bacterium]MDH3529954.1 DinB family protein [Acidobacteriota bacterium]